ncbi:MAG TPA: protein kinase [Vicinamibacterales bacterium]|nr:protein kinase [Vicinamibacterales bacterium]
MNQSDPLVVDRLERERRAERGSRFCHRCQATLSSDVDACGGCGAGRPPSGWAVDPRIGALVAGGQYRVLGRLGAGGFSVVYLVETVIGGLRRALKVLHLEWARDPRARERFVNEAVVLEQLNHPNIARCYAAGTMDDEEAGLYLLLELVEGCSLDALPHPIEPLRAARLAKQIASGLAVAHARGVLHRDLKPTNVLIADPGGPLEQPKIVDFGIAVSLDDDKTTMGTVLGTPRFMAPEQLQPGRALDARVDLWQLGALLSSMLDAQAPHDALTVSHAAAPQRSHPALERLVTRLTATDPEQRPRSAIQVVEELARVEHALSGPRSRGPVGLVETLCERPSDEAWWALCRYLSGLSSVDDQTVAAVDALLSEWPDRLRRAPLGWWESVRRREACALWPLARALDLSGRGLMDDDVREMAREPALASLASLSLAHNAIGNQAVEALAASPHLASLRRLDLGHNRISSAGIEAFANAGGLRGLETLNLASNGLGPRAVEALVAAPFSLRALDLSGNAVQAAGATTLASSEGMAGLQHLDLRDNDLGSDGAGAMATSRRLDALRSLDLGQNGIGSAGAAALALSGNVAGLTRLRLAGNKLGLEGVDLLLSSSRLSALELLDLGSNDLGPQAAMMIGASPFARRLTALVVRDNELGDAGLAALIGAPYLSRLRVLDVARNRLTAAGAAMLGSAPPDLEELDLSGNGLGTTGATVLAAALPRLRLRVLRVSACGLAGDDLGRLLRAAGPRLETLEAAGNDLGPEGAAAFAEGSPVETLRRLDISANRLGVAGVSALAGGQACRAVRELTIDANEIGDAGGEALARALASMPSLEHLRMEDNGIGAGVLAALAESPLANRLVALGLGSNQLTDASVAPVAHGNGWHALRVLDLRHNEISLAAAASILSAPRLSMLAELNLAQNALAGAVDLHSLARRQVALLEQSFARLSGKRADFAEQFYAHLFSRHPGVKPLFAHVSMRRQQEHLMATLSMVVENLRHPDLVAGQIEALGRRHVGYGVFPSQYQAVTSSLLETLRRMLGEDWTEEVEAAWHDGLEAIARTMIRAHGG